jgi:sulfur carrier protein ThiS
VLSGLVLKYRDRVVDAVTKNRELETARIKLAKLFAALTELSNRPNKVVPGAKNTKLERLVHIVYEKTGTPSRVLVFTDSPGLAEDAVEELARQCPWNSHAVALSDRIEVISYTGERSIFRQKQYVRADGSIVPNKEWKTHVLQEIVAKNPTVGAIVLTGSYAVGQNLQQFDTVVHLDRDTWNSVSDTDATLDQIRKYVQELDSDLFDRVVIESQTEALGSELFGMKRTNSSFYKVNRRMMDLAMSPYLAQLKDM